MVWYRFHDQLRDCTEVLFSPFPPQNQDKKSYLVENRTHESAIVKLLLILIGYPLPGTPRDDEYFSSRTLEPKSHIKVSILTKTDSSWIYVSGGRISKKAEIRFLARNIFFREPISMIFRPEKSG